MSSRIGAWEQWLGEECTREKECNGAFKVRRGDIGNEPWEELWAGEDVNVFDSNTNSTY